MWTINALLTQDDAHMLSNEGNEKLISFRPSASLFCGSLSFLPYYGNTLQDIHTLVVSGLSGAAIDLHQVTIRPLDRVMSLTHIESGKS